MDDHAFSDRLGAGNDGLLLAFHFDKAEATRSRRVCFLLNGTKVGDIDAILQCSPEDSFSLRAQDLLIVNRQRYVFHNSALEV
jgi:hypothetical protein